MRGLGLQKGHVLQLFILFGSLTFFALTQNLNVLAYGGQLFGFTVLAPQVWSLYKGGEHKNLSPVTFRILLFINFFYWAFGLQLDNPIIYWCNPVFAMLTAYVLSYLVSKKVFVAEISFHIILWSLVLLAFLLVPSFQEMMHSSTILPNLSAGVAGFLASICFWPQAIKIIKNGCSAGVSLGMYISETSLGVLWNVWAFWGWYILGDMKYFTQWLFNSTTTLAAVFVIYQIIHKRLLVKSL